MRRLPILPLAPTTYSSVYMDQLLNVLRLYFAQQESITAVRAATLNIDVKTLPTEADLANLRSGDVYRDTTADNALKVKL